jgi:hypothetical protein
VYVGKPTVNEEYTTVPITPQQARLRDMTYSAEITVDVEYSRGRVRLPHCQRHLLTCHYTAGTTILQQPAGELVLKLGCHPIALPLPALR